MYSLRLFGGAVLADEDSALTGRAAQRHPLAILALLATAPEKAMSRDKIVALLWPEAGAGKARARLNTAVHAIRKALGEDALLSPGDDLKLDPSLLVVDVCEFEDAIRSGDLERAVQLYQGPLLDGFHLRGSAEFERWTAVERERLRRAYGQALEELSERAEKEGDHARAVKWWRKRAAAEPFSGRVAIRLMEALERAGNRAGAIQHARIHAKLLEDELDSPPDPEVLRLAERLRSAPEAEQHEAGAKAESSTVATKPPAEESLASRQSGTGSGERAVAAELVSRSNAKLPDGRVGNSKSFPAVMNLASWRILIVGAVAIVALAAAGFLILGDDSESELVPDQIVVLPFENQTGNPALDPVGRLAADWTTQSIVRAGLGRIMPFSDLVQTFGPDEDLERLSVAGAAEATGAAIVITGRYYRLGDQLQFHTELHNAQRNALIGAIQPISADTSDPRDGIERISERVTSVLATVIDPRQIFSGGSTEVVGRPPTIEAYQAFADGMERFFRLDYEGAVPLLLQASDLDPSFQRAKLRAIEAHANLDQWHKVDSLLTSVEEAGLQLSRHDRLLLEAFQAHFAHDRELSEDRYSRLAEMFPNSYYEYAAGWQAVAYNHPRKALRRLASMDPSRGPMVRWRGYWHVYSRAYHGLGDYDSELEIVRRGLREFSEPETIYVLELRPLAALGRFGELRKSLERAESAGTPAQMRRFAAGELRAHGHGDTASVYLAEALSWYDAQPPEEQNRLQRGLATTLYQAGQFDSARVIYQAMLAEAQEPTDGPARAELVRLRGVLGAIAAHQNDEDEARRAEEWLRSVDWPHLFGAPALWRARIAAVLGEHDRAVMLLGHGLKSANFGPWVHTDPDFQRLDDHPGFADILQPRGGN